MPLARSLHDQLPLIPNIHRSQTEAFASVSVKIVSQFIAKRGLAFDDSVVGASTTSVQDHFFPGPLSLVCWCLNVRLFLLLLLLLFLCLAFVPAAPAANVRILYSLRGGVLMRATRFSFMHSFIHS